MKRDILAALLIILSLAYATGYVLGGVYKSTQVVEEKTNFMRPCDVCERKSK